MQLQAQVHLPHPSQLRLSFIRTWFCCICLDGLLVEYKELMTSYADLIDQEINRKFEQIFLCIKRNW